MGIGVFSEARKALIDDAFFFWNEAGKPRRAERDGFKIRKLDLNGSE